MLHYMPAQCTSYLTSVKQLNINIAVASLFLWRKAIKKTNKKTPTTFKLLCHVIASNKGRPKRSIYLEFPECSVQIQTQMNPSSSSLHRKAARLTKIFSPATLSILDMSPSIACTMDQCQAHFACGDFFFFFSLP